MQPVPQEKFGPLIKEIARLASEGPLSPFDFRRFEFEAKKMMQSFPGEAHIILGTLACLREDVEDMDKHYQIALQQMGRDINSVFNYAVSLSRVDDWQRALPLAREAYEMKGDNFTLGFFVKTAEYCGETDLVVELQKKWDDNDMEYLNRIESFLTSLENVCCEHPNEIVAPDPQVVALAEELIEGVEV
ncbi:hypothetical protein [Desulfocurvus sp. DL9XJH121]